MKWLGLAAVAALVGLLVLWRLAGSSSSEPAPPPTVVKGADPVGRPPAAVKQATPIATADDDDRPQIEAPAEDAPIRKYSDEFWERVDEVYSRRLLGFAADCYRGGKDRKQKLKVSYFLDINAGHVTVRDVKIVDSTMGDAALEQCMVKAVGKAAWDDPRMPDWKSDPSESEHLLIRIETLKRFAPADDD